MYKPNSFLRKYSPNDKQVFIQDTNNRIRGKINPFRVVHMYNDKNFVKVRLKASNNLMVLKFDTEGEAINALTKMQKAIDILKNKTVDVPNTIKKYIADQIKDLGSDKYFMFRQQTPSNIWEVSHNLNKKSSVTITDDNMVSVEGEVIYIDNNNIEIRFNSNESGWVFLN